MKISIISTIFIAIATCSFGQFIHPPGRHVQGSKGKVWIEIIGKGQPLFLIAGGPGGAHVGLHKFDSLSSLFQLIYIDNYGRGKSDVASNVNEYGIDVDVADIEAIRRHLNFEKIAVLGHSYGSIVAQLYALKYPQHVSHLIVANGFHSGQMWQANDDNSNHEIKTNYPEVWLRLMALRDSGYISNMPAHYNVYGEVPYGFLYAYNPNNFLKSLDKNYPNPFNTALYYQLVGADGDFHVGGDIAAFDCRMQLKTLTMPVLVIAGRYDRVSVPSYAIQYKQYCKQAEFVMFEKSGHNPQVEEPEKLFSILYNFLQKK
jgi:proline iminopeptidase